MKVLQLRPTLMPHQVEFVMDDHTPLQALVGGYRSGKSVAGVWKALRCAVELFPGENGVIMAPIAGMNQTNIVPILREILPRTGLEYDVDRLMSERCYRLDIKVGNKISGIYLDVSAENSKRMVGRSLAWGYFDEADLCRNPDLAYQAFTQMKARLSEAENSLAFATSTPEGYGFMHKKFVEEADEESRIWHVSMEDNFLLPKSYVAGQLKNIPFDKQDAYVKGLFANIFTATVYKGFNRDLSHTDVTLEDAGPTAELHIGMDFNIEHCAAVVHVIQNEEPRAVFEFIDQYDTDAMCQAIKEKFKDHQGEIYIYPDASGKNRSPAGPTTSHAIIRSYGFKIRVPNRNPGVHKDQRDGEGNRINSMNGMFHNALGQRRYLVNTTTCPTYTKCLERQSWKKSPSGAYEPDKSNNIDHPLDAAGYFIHHQYPLTASDAPKLRTY